jgi:hypothetical protein
VSPEKRRHTFISYSRVNKEFAVKLARELKSAGFPIWLDLLDIPAGARWDDEIEKALSECGIFMMILTPASIASENAKDEIGYAIDHGKRILPVLLEDCAVPLRIRRFQYVDFTSMNFDQGLRTAKELLTKLMKEDSPPTGNRVPMSKERPTRPSIPDAYKALAPEPPVIPPKQTAARRTVLYAGVAVLLLAILGGAAFLTGIFSSNPPSPTAPPTQRIEPTSAPASIVVADTPLPEPTRFYTEEFDGSLAAWTFVRKSGRENSEFTYAPTGGKLVVNITPKGDEPWGYLIHPAMSYTDVQLEIVTTNNGNNSNGVSLVCRYSALGWYEFWISNNGRYGIYAFGPDGEILQAGYQLAESGSPAIRTGKAENTYTAACKGDDLSLTINGKPIKTVKAKYDFTEGNVGIGFSAFQNNPIDVEFASLKISQP